MGVILVFYMQLKNESDLIFCLDSASFFVILFYCIAV